MASAVAHGFKNVAVVGCGQMGLGIAYVAAVNAKVKVSVYDPNEKALSKSLGFFDKLLEKDVKKSKLSQDDATAARERVSTVSTLDALSSIDLAIEAAPEKLEIKQAIFRDLATHAPAHAVLATNTSSISLSKIAASAVSAKDSASSAQSQSPSRVLGLHWMNPVPVMKLVEIIAALQTTPEVIERAKAFAVACGKTVTVSQDTPGFVANRILLPFINEAIVCLETGIASKEDIDTTAKLGFGHPMGPLTLADFIGLDTCLSIMEVLYRETSDSKYRPAVLLARMVDAGYLGVKSGKGFFECAWRRAVPADSRSYQK